MKLSVYLVKEGARRFRKELVIVNDNVLSIIHKDDEHTEQVHVVLPDPTDPGCGASRDLVVLAA